MLFRSGVTFGSTFKGLAKRAKQLAVVRNYAPHNISDHAKAIKHVLTAGNALGMEAGQGAIHTRLHGRSYTDHGIPVFTRLIQDEVEDEYMQDRIRMRSGNKAGALGPSNAPFDPLGGGVLNDDLKLNLPISQTFCQLYFSLELDRISFCLFGSFCNHFF